MLPGYIEKQENIQKEISLIFTKDQDTSNMGLAMIGAKQATSEMLELENPKIITKSGEIKIFSRRIYAISVAQLKLIIQQKYTAYERFPIVVEDFLKFGRKSKELSEMRQSHEITDALMDLEALLSVYHRNESKAIVFLSRLSPTVSPVTEYTDSGGHTSGIRSLKAIEAPFIIEASGARFPFSASEAKISDGRTETNMIANMRNTRLIVNDVKNTISIREEGSSKKRIKDGLSIMSILLLIFGFGLLLARKGGVWEIGLMLIVFGVAAFYYRYYSDWSREYFTPGQVEMAGDAPMGLAFVGELV
jgi:hypothetical protein